MKRFVQSVCTAGYVGMAALIGLTGPSLGHATLSNPAADFCVTTGGLYGVRESDAGDRGICVLPSGEEIDAWDYVRTTLNREAAMDAPKRANPAASYCVALGGSYTLENATCALPDGSEMNAWDMLRDAHAQAMSMANPSATFCLEKGGAYEIRASDGGQIGICRLPDGTEKEAWALFREMK